MKEFEVTVQVRNNRLKERRDALGLTRAELAEKAGICPTSYGRMEALKAKPTTRIGGWRADALKLAGFFGVKPDELFPPAMFEVDDPEKTFTADGDELVRLTALSSKSALQLTGDPEARIEGQEIRGVIDQLIEGLTQREQDVLKRRFGLDGPEETFADIGVDMGRLDGRRDVRGVTPEIVRQIQAKALRRLRYPWASKVLKAALGRDR